MAQVFGASKANSPTPPAAALRIQSSIDGKPRPLIWGTTRVASNLIWYGDFFAIQQQSAQGGKGTGGGGGGKGTAGSGNYVYEAALAMALGEGQIASIGRVWNSKSVTSLADLNLGLFVGSAAQTAWSYLTTLHPDQAIAYRRTAYVAAGPLQLGNNPELPNLTFEVVSSITATGFSDANAADVIADFLGNTFYGVPQWVTGYNGNWTTARNYWTATGLLVSYALTEAVSASSFLQTLLEALNVDPVWSDKALKLVPRGDTAITANGATYTPPAAPIYDFTDDDYLVNQAAGQSSGTSSDPVGGVRRAPREQYNIIKVEYLDRATDYNVASIVRPNPASIALYGPRTKSTAQWHFFHTGAVAQLAADLALGREQIKNQYVFTSRPRFILLDPGDVVSITDSVLGLARQWVKILDIQENADRSLNFLVEEYLAGTGAAPQYGRTAGQGHRPNYNADPGDINPPIIFEPTDELGGGLAIWAAVSGQDSALYGGCDLFVSSDDDSYTFAARQVGPARMGVTTATLAAVAVNVIGQTIDQVNTLSVNLAESDAQIISGSLQDALALNTACYVGGEIIAYQTAALTAPNAYDLTYLVRGAFGTEAEIASHAAGAPFCRLDGSILKIPFDQGRIGSTIYLKFVPFNVWGGGGKTIADVGAIPYTITGAALASPLPVVAHLTTKFVDGRLNLTWDEIDDFRSGIRYEIRLGDTFAGALSLGSVAHPPFVAPGDGTYWITGWCQPTAGLIVRSETPVSLDVVGATLDVNVVATFDCKAAGWTGIFGGGCGVDSGLNAVRTGGAGNILTDPNILAEPDILNLGGQQSGTYTPNFIVDVGRVAPVTVTITWKGTGIPVGQNILAAQNVLDMPDVLGAASAAFVDVFPSLLISQQGPGNILTEANVLSDTNVLGTGSFAAAQKYSPGNYVGRVFAFQWDLDTVDPQTIAALLEAKISLSVPARVDSHATIASVVTSLTDMVLPAAGVSLVFTPDGTSTAAAFNGGPGGIPNTPGLPQIIASWGDEQAGDTLSVTSLTLSGCTVQIKNGGSGVQRNHVNLFVRGY